MLIDKSMHCSPGKRGPEEDTILCTILSTLLYRVIFLTAPPPPKKYKFKKNWSIPTGHPLKDRHAITLCCPVLRDFRGGAVRIL